MSLAFLSIIEGLGSAYGVDTYSAGVERLQKALASLAATDWPTARPGRVDGFLDQTTVQALGNVVQHVPKIPDAIRTALRVGIPLLIQFGWNSSQAVSVRSAIKANAVTIAVPIESYATVRRLQGKSPSPPPAGSSSGAPGASGPGAPMSVGVKVGIAIAVPVALLIAVKLLG